MLPHGGDSGGVRRLRKIAEGLCQRGHDLETVLLRNGSGPLVPWNSIPERCRRFDCLVCPGDLPLWELEPYIPVSCRLHTFHLHFGVHDWSAEQGNILSGRIRKATTARWIQERIRRMGAGCRWFGVAPFEDGIYPEPSPRAFRIGTLAHAWYGWKNTGAVVQAMPEIRRQCPGVELWSYGQTEMPMPGRFFLNPAGALRRWIYNSCRVWVVPSISEGIGMCGLEAMLCHTPVVSADNRGVREYADESTCLLYPPADVDLMVRSIVSLLRNPDQAGVLADRAYDRVSRLRFSDCIDRIESILLEQEPS